MKCMSWLRLRIQLAIQIQKKFPFFLATEFDQLDKTH